MFVFLCLSTAHVAFGDDIPALRGRTTAVDHEAEVKSVERPDLDFLGPYNVINQEFEETGTPTWAERKDLTPLSFEEFLAVRQEIVEAIYRGSPDDDGLDGYGDSYYVYDDKFFDRTQKIEIGTPKDLTITLPAVVSEIQSALKKRPLWRVMFIGEGNSDDQARETFFVVYPEVIRIKQHVEGQEISEAVKENARIRQKIAEGRRAHQKQRITNLRESVARTIKQLNHDSSRVVLVAWYDTLSAADFDWGLEGKPGSSVWLLSKSPVDEKSIEGEFATYWATADGTISDTRPVLETPYQLLHFENSDEIVPEVNVKISGVLYAFSKKGENKPK